MCHLVDLGSPSNAWHTDWGLGKRGAYVDGGGDEHGVDVVAGELDCVSEACRGDQPEHPVHHVGSVDP